MKFFPLVFKNIFRKKTRTLLTIGSIVLPLLVICLLGTFIRALDRPDPGATRGMFRLVTRHRVALTSPLPVTYADRIAAMTDQGVVAVTKFAWFGGRYIDNSPKNFFPRFAVEARTFLQVFDDATIKEGTAQDWLSDRTGCVVGEDTAEKLGFKVGNKFTLVGDIYPVSLELTVKGIYRLPEAGAARAVFFHREYLEEALPRFKGVTGTIWTKARDAKSAEALATLIDAQYENSPYPTKTESEKAFQMGFVSMLGNVKLLVIAISVVIVIVIVLIAANTMAMAARERVTEIAVLRTLGFQKNTILALVLSESLLISVIGGLAGTAFFVAMQPALKRALASSPMAGLAGSLRPEPEILGLGLLVALGVGVVAGIIPAIRSAQRPITDGLRQVA